MCVLVRWCWRGDVRWWSLHEWFIGRPNLLFVLCEEFHHFSKKIWLCPTESPIPLIIAYMFRKGICKPEATYGQYMNRNIMDPAFWIQLKQGSFLSRRSRVGALKGAAVKVTCGNGDTCVYDRTADTLGKVVREVFTEFQCSRASSVPISRFRHSFSWPFTWKGCSYKIHVLLKCQSYICSNARWVFCLRKRPQQTNKTPQQMMSATIL